MLAIAMNTLPELESRRNRRVQYDIRECVCYVLRQISSSKFHRHYVQIMSMFNLSKFHLNHVSITCYFDLMSHIMSHMYLNFVEIPEKSVLYSLILSNDGLIEKNEVYPNLVSLGLNLCRWCSEVLNSEMVFVLVHLCQDFY